MRNSRIGAAVVTATLLAAAVAIAANKPTRAEAQSGTGARSAELRFFSIQQISGGGVRIGETCTDVTVIPATLPRPSGIGVPGVVVLCERS
jgi:hypothetical protein